MILLAYAAVAVLLALLCHAANRRARYRRAWAREAAGQTVAALAWCIALAYLLGWVYLVAGPWLRGA